jgi:hypothetical protein
MLATGIVCFFLGIASTLAVQGFATWTRARGLALGPWRWAACIAWALLLVGVVFFASASVGEGEPRAALFGGIAGLVVFALATAALWWFVLRDGPGRSRAH